MNRFVLHLEDEDGNTIMKSQYRELKMMMMDELALVHSTATIDASYDRMHDENGYCFVLRARDAHELGRGDVFETAEEMERQIEAVKAAVPDAEFVDQTPEETYVKAIDYIREESSKMLAAQGIAFE